jgi:5-formyltetrahydrofolate cyclo-ligase
LNSAPLSWGNLAKPGHPSCSAAVLQGMLQMVNDTTTNEIRRLKRQQRRQLDNHTRLHNSLSLRSRLSHDRNYRYCTHIALYLANDGEIDPHYICEHAWDNGKQVYLPILAPLKDSLYFAPYLPDSKLQLNRFNIPEPVCRPSEWKTAKQMDLLLLPLVAFDEQGNRIGMGGGFYDRTLAYLRYRTNWRKPVLVGLAHEIQKTGSLVTQSWDIPLDYVLTEEGRYP